MGRAPVPRRLGTGTEVFHSQLVLSRSRAGPVAVLRAPSQHCAHVLCTEDHGRAWVRADVCVST